MIRKKAVGLTALGVSPEGVVAARLSRSPGRPPIVHTYDVVASEQEPADRALAHLASRLGLKHARATTVLNPTDYKLLVTEAPDVRAEELRAALRWRVKDLIEFHVNDVTLDAFELPAGERRAAGRSMFVVVVENRVIRQRVDLLTAAGVPLDVIDIPELAQRNLAALTPEDANGTAFLSLSEASGLITVTRQGELYFSRSLDLGRRDFLTNASEAMFERLTLEIQRSLDYFDSHFRQPPLAHLVIDPLAASVPGLVERLSSGLAVRTTTLDMRALFDWQVPPPERPSLAVLGAALREEEAVL